MFQTTNQLRSCFKSPPITWIHGAVLRWPRRRPSCHWRRDPRRNFPVTAGHLTPNRRGQRMFNQQLKKKNITENSSQSSQPLLKLPTPNLIWVNYNNSLICILRPFGDDSPISKPWFPVRENSSPLHHLRAAPVEPGQDVDGGQQGCMDVQLAGHKAWKMRWELMETLGIFGGKTHGKTQRNMWEYGKNCGSFVGGWTSMFMWEYGKNCGIFVGVWTSMFMWEYGKNCGSFVGVWTSMSMWEYGKTHGKTKKETSVNRPSETK